MNALTDLAELNAAIHAQIEIVSDLIDPYLDQQADHNGEVARPGDSWPGAAGQISRAGAAFRAAQEVLWDLPRYDRRGARSRPRDGPRRRSIQDPRRSRNQRLFVRHSRPLDVRRQPLLWHASPVAGRNPWKTATIAIVATLAVAGVGAGAFLAGRSTNEAASTTTSPAPVQQTAQPAEDDDPSDGVLSESEYPGAQSLIDAAVDDPGASQLPRETMQSMADQMCSIARASATGAEAHEAYKTRLRTNSPQVSDVFQEEAADIAISAALFVCLDDIPS